MATGSKPARERSFARCTAHPSRPDQAVARRPGGSERSTAQMEARLADCRTAVAGAGCRIGTGRRGRRCAYETSDRGERALPRAVPQAIGPSARTAMPVLGTCWRRSYRVRPPVAFAPTGGGCLPALFRARAMRAGQRIRSADMPRHAPPEADRADRAADRWSDELDGRGGGDAGDRADRGPARPWDEGGRTWALRQGDRPSVSSSPMAWWRARRAHEALASPGPRAEDLRIRGRAKAAPLWGSLRIRPPPSARKLDLKPDKGSPRPRGSSARSACRCGSRSRRFILTKGRCFKRSCWAAPWTASMSPSRRPVPQRPSAVRKLAHHWRSPPWCGPAFAGTRASIPGPLATGAIFAPCRGSGAAALATPTQENRPGHGRARRTPSVPP